MGVLVFMLTDQNRQVLCVSYCLNLKGKYCYKLLASVLKAITSGKSIHLFCCLKKLNKYYDLQKLNVHRLCFLKQLFYFEQTGS